MDGPKFSYTTWLPINRMRLEKEYLALHPHDERAKVTLTAIKASYFMNEYNKYLSN